jgi:hypothetical protein
VDIFMGNRKTLRSYVESGEDVTGVRFSGNFGGECGDLRDYHFLDGGVLGEADSAHVILCGSAVYMGRNEFPVRVANHLTDYAPADV